MNVPLRYLSVCSGIEAATVAWHALGWQPLAFSEIDPFASAVLQHHYPGVPNVGDLEEIEARAIAGVLPIRLADVDVLVGGTPCQSFSNAGLRGGLADARGNLSLLFVRLANAIDHFRRAAGRPPVWVVWENVPGVLTHADNPFGSILGGLVGSDGAIDPAGGGGWTYAGCG